VALREPAPARLTALLLLLLYVAATPLAHSAPRVLVLGDSLSAAYGMDPEDGWVAMLGERLGQDFPGASVINASISGETTGGGLARLPQLLATHRPDTVILELGANDGLRGFPLTTLEANLRALAEQSRAAGAEVILVTMHVPPNYGQRYAEQFTATYRRLASETGITLAPFLLDGVAGKPELIQADGLHPVAEAQPLMLANVLPTVTQVLTARQARLAVEPGAG